MRKGYLAGVIGGSSDVLLRTANLQLYLDFTTNRNKLTGAPATDLLTTTRASTGAYIGKNDRVTNFAVDVPRIGDLGIYIGQGATNILLQSNSLSQSPWQVNPAWLQSNTLDVLDPAGTNTATRVTIPTGAVSNPYQSVTVTASTEYTLSHFVRLGTLPASDFKIALYDETAGSFIVQDVVPTFALGLSADSFTRYTYTFTTPVGCTALRVYGIRNTNVVTGGTVYFYDMLLETGYRASPPITTTTVPVACSADQVIFNTLTWFNNAAGTLYAKAQQRANIGTAAIFAFDDNTVNNRIRIGHNAGLQGRMPIVNAGAVEADIYTAFTAAAVGLHKFAGCYATNYAQAASDGNVGVLDTVVNIPVWNRATIGRYPAGPYWNGYINEVAFFNRALTNAELQRITEFV